ncbi:MAG: hypothetical protein ACPGYV_14785, partial [Phycisphaeraceae bacterium]
LFGHRKTIEIPYDDLNVWIANEGTQLLEEIGVDLPRSVKGAMVDAPRDGVVRISFEIDGRNSEQVLTLSFAIAVGDDGTVTSELVGATAGRMPLPTQTAIDLIAARADGHTTLIDLMTGQPVAPVDVPIDPSKDGVRDGRLVGLTVRTDALVVTRETIERQQPTQN